MRSFDFRAKNIGRERYLTYIMGEGSEMDEDTLDYCEENDVQDLIKIIYEEDDDYDYLTYDVTGRTSLEKYTQNVIKKEKVLKIIRNICLSLISFKEQTIHLSYILLNKSFIYIDAETLKLDFICLPVESEAAVMKEFKNFVRFFLASLRYDVNEDLSYVGMLIAFINGDQFNLRGLIGLTEALMSDSDISFDEASTDISTEDGSEVVDTAVETATEEKKGFSDYMDNLGGADEKLPEIGDDAEEEPEEEAEPVKLDESDSALEDEISATFESLTGMLTSGQSTFKDKSSEEMGLTPLAQKEPEEPLEELEDEEAPSEEEIADRIRNLVNGKHKMAMKDPEPITQEELDEDIPNRDIVKTSNIKVNRASLIQNAQDMEDKQDKEDGLTERLDGDITELSTISKNSEKNKAAKTSAPVIDTSASEEGRTPRPALNIKINPYIIRVDNEEKIIINKAVFKLGKASRGVDYHISGNGAISRQHAIITKKDDGYYLKDNKSTNHTYINDRQLEDGEEVLLKNNAKFRLGDETFVFKIG